MRRKIDEEARPRPLPRTLPLPLVRRRSTPLGRSEHERLFWERVARGQRVRRHPLFMSRPEASTGAASGRSEPHKPHKGRQIQDRRESFETALVTILTVMIFGVGWATLELDAAEADVISAGLDETVTTERFEEKRWTRRLNQK